MSLRAWHMRHHYSPKSGNFGVTTRLWDHVFGTAISARLTRRSSRHECPVMSAQLSATNPMRTDGFEFVEYAAPEPETLRRLFESMGLPAVARHRSKERDSAQSGRYQFHHQRGAR